MTVATKQGGFVMMVLLIIVVVLVFLAIAVGYQLANSTLSSAIITKPPCFVATVMGNSSGSRSSETTCLYYFALP